MKKCKKCNLDFEPKKGLINFCSLECRNSRVWSDEDKLKKSISAKNSDKVKSNTIKRPKDFWVELAEERKKIHREKILKADYEKLSFESLRFRILYEQENKCSRCGIDTWLGEKIILELEHKDGDHNNNKRENLESLCPNCHSQTETWRGKNKKNKQNKVSDDDIVKTYLKNKNIRQTLIELGLSAKGGNYKRLHQLIKKYDL